MTRSVVLSMSSSVSVELKVMFDDSSISAKVSDSAKTLIDLRYPVLKMPSVSHFPITRPSVVADMIRDRLVRPIDDMLDL